MKQFPDSWEAENLRILLNSTAVSHPYSEVDKISTPLLLVIGEQEIRDSMTPLTPWSFIGHCVKLAAR